MGILDLAQRPHQGNGRGASDAARFQVAFQVSGRTLEGAIGRNAVASVAPLPQCLIVHPQAEKIDDPDSAGSKGPRFRAGPHAIPASAIASVSARSRVWAPLPNHVLASRVLAVWPFTWSL